MTWRQNRRKKTVRVCRHCGRVATGRHRIGWTWCPNMQVQYQENERRIAAREARGDGVG